MVDLLVAGKILRDRAVGYLVDHDAGFVELFHIRLEVAQVAAKDNGAASGKQTAHVDKQLCMVCLDIPSATAHLGAVGKRRRVDKDEVPAVL